MAVNNGKISAPISVYDVSQVLHSEHLDTVGLCKEAKINKWSKYKPIEYGKIGKLTEAEWRRNDNGVYYGLKASNNLGNIKDLLNVNFAYIARPKGGIASPCRLSDFEGYDHYALPTMSGTVMGAWYNVDESLLIDFDIDTGGHNTTGVDIGGLVNPGTTQTREESLAQLARLYPCLIIQNTTSGDAYAKALYLRGAVEKTQGRLYDRTWRLRWYCDLQEMNNRGFLRDGDFLMTVFLTEDISQVSTFTEWTEVRDDMQTAIAFAVPMASAIRIRLEAYISGYMPYISIPDTISVAANESISFAVGLQPRPAPGHPETVNVELNGMVKTVAVTASSDGIVSFSWTEMNILPLPGDVYRFTASAVSGGNPVSREFEIIVR